MPVVQLATSVGAKADDGKLPYQDSTFWAYAFLNDLNSNQLMKDAWTKLLATIKASPDPISVKVQAVDNFLVSYGYDTTGKEVLDILKADWWEAYLKARQPNPASDKFVQDLLADPDLATDWSVAASEASANNTTPLDDFLHKRGYDCTAQQVSASFDAMRRHNMNFWTGLYGKTTLTPKSGGSPAVGPAVILYGDTDFTLGPAHVIGFTYKNGVLSWDYNDGDPLKANQSRGSITFSHATEPRKADQYVGNLFSGTIELKEPWIGIAAGSYDFYGQIGDPPDNRPGHIVTPPSVNKEPVKNLHYYLQQILFYGGLAMLAYFVGQVTGINKFITDRFEQFKNSMKERASELKERFADSGEGPDDPANFDRSTTVRQIENEGLPKAEEIEKINEAEAEQKVADAKAEEDISDEGETAEDLDDIVEL
jgi:hypothetical protein